MVEIEHANAVNPAVSGSFDGEMWARELGSSGVVMVTDDSTGSGEPEDFVEALSASSSVPQLSGRMKHLLFGVRLSAGSAQLPPANDLEQLAGRADAMRVKRMAKVCASARCSR